MKSLGSSILAASAIIGSLLFAVAGQGQSGRPGGPVEADSYHGRMVATGGELGTLRFACLSCHQLDGAADSSGAFPRLAGQSAWYLYSSLVEFGTGGRPSPVMGPIAAELDDREMKDVSAYYASLAETPYPPFLAPSQKDVEAGQKIAEIGAGGVPACASCHGPRGVGNPPLYPYLAGQLQPYLEAQLRAFKAGSRGGDTMNVMHGIAAQLTSDQIREVAAYFASLRPNRVATSQSRFMLSSRMAPQAIPEKTGATINPQARSDRTVVPGASSSP